MRSSKIFVLSFRECKVTQCCWDLIESAIKMIRYPNDVIEIAGSPLVGRILCSNVVMSLHTEIVSFIHNTIETNTSLLISHYLSSNSVTSWPHLSAGTKTNFLGPDLRGGFVGTGMDSSRFWWRREFVFRLSQQGYQCWRLSLDIKHSKLLSRTGPST